MGWKRLSEVTRASDDARGSGARWCQWPCGLGEAERVGNKGGRRVGPGKKEELGLVAASSMGAVRRHSSSGGDRKTVR